MLKTKQERFEYQTVFGLTRLGIEPVF